MPETKKVISLIDLDTLEEFRLHFLLKAKRHERGGEKGKARLFRKVAYAFTRRIYRIQGKPLPV